MTDPLDPNLDRELAGRWVTETASPEERRALERWMAEDPARRALVAQLEEAWRRAGAFDARPSADDAVDLDAKWLAIRQAMGPTRVVTFPSPLSRPSRLRRHAAAYAAAAATIMVTIGAALLWTADTKRGVPGAAAPVAMHEYVTPRGQRAGFRLPDGTQVMLSVDSRLRVPADYGVRDRELYLSGEAYFEVRHDPAARFLVHTQHAVTEDLGTRFAVRAYPTDTVVQVVVAEGQVAVRAARKQALLGAGQRGRATQGGEVTTQSDGDVEHYLAWTKGRLEFRGVPLKDALPEMNRWFDLDFRLGDSALAGRRLTAAFRDQPDDQILRGVARTLVLRFERQGRVVTFYDASGVDGQ
jgi:ferric-dicitrate binding protein FerR (iron transport regulator)